MMTQGYYTGISGMLSYQTAINVAADNLANISTVGFRGSNIEFANLYQHSLNTVVNQESVGIGTRVNATVSLQEKGSILLTDRSTDLAILDEGWFGIEGVGGEKFYTRAGDFTFDVDNDLVTPDGFHVLGTMPGNITGEQLTQRVVETDLGDVSEQVPLTFPKYLYFPPEPTSTAKMIGNIGVFAEADQEDNSIVAKATKDNVITPEEELNETQIISGTVKSDTLSENNNTVTVKVNGVDYTTTANASTGYWEIEIPTVELQEDSIADINVADVNLEFPVRFGSSDLGESDIRKIGAGLVDPNGDRTHLNISFEKVEPQVPPGSQWQAVATVKSLDGDTTYDTKEGIVEFNPNGSLKSSPFTTIDNNGKDVTIDLGNGFDGIVSLANISQTSSSIADGVIAGELEGYEINPNAEVIATFTNGMQSSVGRIGIYHFQNDQGLDRITGTRFQSSSNSGDAFFYKDENGKNIIGSSISNYHLENSNVKMEVGLTELIIFQRSYDANSKAITTADQMMQKALQMDA